MSTTSTTATDTGRSATEDVLWAALATEPDATATVLAKTASIGASTARKILTRWATEGLVTRTPDPNPRAADRWTRATLGTAEENPADATPIEQAPADTETADKAPAEPPTDTTTATDDDPAPAPVEAGAEVEVAAVSEEPEPAAVGEQAAAGDGVCPTCGRGGRRSSSGTALPPGSLRGLVEDYLRDHPDEEFTPGAIGKALTRSSGAVYNACFKLTELGVAHQTCEQPKRFALHPDQKQ
ncbi:MULTISPECIES: helix-turn-helix domain-containing protein [unclassified Nocardia]|uniref:helix-turn-helix domain-containing protein n=1 Tax=unclassified Nocardia TaxID=2637762 RepID=UPI00278C3CCF|nr:MULTISPECIES: helix-turn-helix domain-containing protein [unclassified Nocardia]